MSRTMLVFLLCASEKLVDSKINVLSTDGATLRNSTAQCLYALAVNYFGDGETVFYTLPLQEVNKNENSTLRLYDLTLPLLSTRWPLIIRSRRSNPWTYVNEAPKNYVIQWRHLQELSRQIEILRNSVTWNPHGRFVVISSKATGLANNTAEDVMKIFWSYRILNIVILLPNYPVDLKINIYGSFSFEDSTCKQKLSEPIQFGSCKFGNLKIKNNRYKLLNSLPKSFGGCVVRVRMVDAAPYTMNIPNNSFSTRNFYSRNKGLEANILDVAAETLNLTIHYISSGKDYGDVYMNGTASGNVKYLLNNEADVIIAHYAKTVERAFMFDTSLSYYQESIHWCVPREPLTRDVDMLTKVISTDAWIALVLIYLVSSILMWILAKDLEFQMYRHLGVCLLKCFSILLGIAIAHSPKSRHVRFITFILIFTSLPLLIAYQTRLMSALSQKNYKLQISTVDDIYKYNLKTLISPYMHRYISSYGKQYPNNNKWENCIDFEECLDKVAFTRNCAAWFEKSFIDYALNGYMNAQQEPLVYCFKEAIVTYPVNILMRKGFPLFNHINNIVSKLFDSGFVIKWQLDILQANFRNQTIEFIDEEQSSGYLNLFDLLPIFLFLASALLIALVVFLVEIMFSKFLMKKLKLIK